MAPNIIAERSELNIPRVRYLAVQLFSCTIVIVRYTASHPHITKVSYLVGWLVSLKASTSYEVTLKHRISELF